MRQNNKELCEDNCASTKGVDFIENGKLKRCYCDVNCERDGACCHDRAGTCPTPEPLPADGCVDKTLGDGSPWHDSNSKALTCEAYEIADFCGENSIVDTTVIADAFAFEGLTARFACCICGGGQKTPTTTTTVTTVTTVTLSTTTTTTTTTTTISTPTTTETSTTATTITTEKKVTFATGDCRAPGSSCKDCNAATGVCERCRNEMYLLGGICGDASVCKTAGLIPTGTASSGRACIAEGGLCEVPACKPTVGSCAASTVTAGGEVCAKCSSETFVVNGECKYRLTCKGPRFYETGAKCTCRHRKEEGGDVEKNCHRCHTYGSMKEGSYPATGPDYKHTYVKCYGCSGGYYFYNGACIKKAECPAFLVAYEGNNGYKNFCEEPFTCANNRKANGPNAGQPCKCKEKNCSQCDWQAGDKSYVCTECKRRQYLFQGACIDSARCIASGGVPIGSESPNQVDEE